MPPPPSAAAAPPTGEQGADDLADILAQLQDEPVPSPATPDRSAARQDGGVSSTAAPAAGAGKKLTDPRDLERPSTASGIVIESEGGINFDPTFASFDKRALELVVDTAVLGLFLLPGLVIAAVAGSLWVIGVLIALIGFVLFVGVTARSIAAGGQSVGNRVAGTRIVDGINGANIDVGRAALRVAARYLVSMILFLGFLIAFTDGQRRTFHDRLAGSIVTGRERAVWTAGDQTG